MVNIERVIVKLLKICVSEINKNVQEITCAGKGNYNDFSVPPPMEASCLVVQTVNSDSEFSLPNFMLC